MAICALKNSFIGGMVLKISMSVPWERLPIQVTFVALLFSWCGLFRGWESIGNETRLRHSLVAVVVLFSYKRGQLVLC